MPTNQCLVLKHSNLVKGTSFIAQIWLLIDMRQKGHHLEIYFLSVTTPSHVALLGFSLITFVMT